MARPERPDSVNILLVDDQPSKLLTYETILEELGEHLIAVSSATEALECLLKNDIAVVLVDVCMPDFDGYQLAAMIRQHPRFQQTSIIFVSAILMTDPDRLRGYECGAVDYVPVPVVPEILRAKVTVFAELHRKTRALERLNSELEERVCQRTAELEATTAALKEADRRKDEFLAILAHELRNPLAPIRTAVQILKSKDTGETHAVRARAIIDRQVEHLVRLIDDLLDVSRISRGIITLHREPVPVGEAVASALEACRPGIESRGHDLAIDLPEAPLMVWGDKTRLVQVISNMLHNATKFTGAGGRIGLTVTGEDDVAVITVTDTGVGIPEDVLPKLFGLFSRFHAESEGGQSGLGIGLALVRRLVEMHDGSVSAQSEGPGRGAQFVVRIPLLVPDASHLRAPAAESESRPPAPARRVLIADDNRDAAEALAALLALHGHDVRVAHDGVQALAVAKRFRPEVLLLDLGMPRLDGYRTAREIRRRPWGQQAIIVALTGWGQEQDRQRTREASFDLHLVKPVTEAQLLEALASAAGGAVPGPDLATPVLSIDRD
jgi:signal transduction histidine kinase